VMLYSFCKSVELLRKTSSFDLTKMRRKYRMMRLILQYHKTFISSLEGLNGVVYDVGSGSILSHRRHWRGSLPDGGEKSGKLVALGPYLKPVAAGLWKHIAWLNFCEE
jgi:hypothetical protein